MAPGVVRSAAIVVAVCAATAVAWLPPGADPGGTEPAHRDAVVRERQRLTDTLNAAYRTLRFLEIRDSLIAALGNSDSTIRAVTGPGVSSEWRAWLVDQARETTTGAPAPGAKVLSVLLAAGPDHDMAFTRWGGNSTVTAIDAAAAPFRCLAVHHLRLYWRVGEASIVLGPERFRSRSALGVCRFHVDFGDPGPGVREWLSQGAALFAGVQADSDSVETRHSSADWERLYWYLLDEGQFVLAACIAGSARRCGEWVLSPGAYDRGVIRLEANSAFWNFWWWSGFAGSLLPALRQESGDSAFRTFWTSSLPVDQAFRASFGADIGAWTRDWLDRRHGRPRQLRVQGGDYVVTLLIAGMLLALGTAKAYRRTARR